MRFNSIRFKHGKFAIQCETKFDAKNLLKRLKLNYNIEFSATFKEYMDSYEAGNHCFAYDDDYIYLVVGTEKAIKNHINKNIKIIKYQNIHWGD